MIKAFLTVSIEKFFYCIHFRNNNHNVVVVVVVVTLGNATEMVFKITTF